VTENTPAGPPGLPAVTVEACSPGGTVAGTGTTAGTREQLTELSAPSGAVGDSISVAVWTAISRVSGVLRGVTLAAVLGATFFANTYQFTNSLPNLVFYGFLGGSLFSSLIVPAVVGRVDADDPRGVARTAGGLLGVTMLGMLVLVPVVALLTPVMLGIGTIGVSRTGQLAGQEKVGAVLVLLLLPQVPLYAVVGTATAVMNAYRKFALAAAAPALENLGSIFVLVLVLLLFPGIAADDQVPTPLLLLLGLGTTGAVALHAATQWWGARRLGVVLRPRAGWRQPEVRALLRRAAPSVVQAGLSALLLVILLVLANRTPGGVVAFQLAMNFFFLPIAVGATPVALSLGPRLSRMNGPGDAVAFRETYVRGLVFAAFLVAPAAIAYGVLAAPLSRAIAYGGFAGPGGVELLAASITGLAAGVLGETCFLVTTYACYARHDTRSPLRGMVVQVVVGLAVVSWTPSVPGPHALMLLGLGLSAGSLAGSAYLASRLLRTLPPGSEPVLRPLGRITFASVSMVLPAWAVAELLPARLHVHITPAATALAAVAVGAGSYVGLQRRLGAPELDWVGAAIGSRFRSGGRPPAPRSRNVDRPQRLREVLNRLGTDLFLLVVAVGVGALLASNLALAVAVLAVAALLGWIVARPQVGAYLLISTTPLIAGIDRGSVIPALRPNEVVLLLTAVGLCLRRVVTARTGERWRPKLSGLELALLTLAVTGSFLPLIMMTLRRREIITDDLLHCVALWKLVVAYAVIRLAVSTREHVIRCVWLSLLCSSAVCVIGVLQALNLFGIPKVLATYYAPFGVASALTIGRGSSTLSLPAAVADLGILNLALAIGLLVRGSRHRPLLTALCVTYVFGVLAAAEFSTVVGLLVAFAVVVVLTGSRRLIIYAIPAAVVASVVLWPVVQTRLMGFQSASGLPASWIGRLRNLRTYFWPTLQADHNWILGVRPSARVPSRAQEFGWIWIESGYTWLLWAGGLPFLAGYVALVVAAARRGWSYARRHNDIVGVVGTGLAATVIADAVLMIFDPHLTYRGAGDALFFTMALAMAVPTRTAEETTGRVEETAGPAGEIAGRTEPEPCREGT
jgi:putative peptidoglycan lipid II flippase